MVSLFKNTVGLFLLAASLTIMVAMHTSAHALENQTGRLYGEHARQKYDVYYPNTVTDQTPILFFIYGGSWESGNRDRYDFVGKSFSSKGYITVIPDYRLYPEVRFPTFVEDAALALNRVKRDLGANRPFFVAGHSAGAQIGSLLALDDRYLAQHGLSNCADINGFIGLAGPYDFLPLTSEKFFDIFPEQTRAESQAINFVDGIDPPALLLHGRMDGMVDAQDSEKLANLMKGAGNKAEAKIYPLANHVSVVAALAPLASLLAPTKRDMIRFMEQHKSAKFCAK